MCYFVEVHFCGNNFRKTICYSWCGRSPHLVDGLVWTISWCLTWPDLIAWITLSWRFRDGFLWLYCYNALRQAARSIRICETRLLHVWPSHTATEHFTIWFNFRMTPVNIADYCFSFCNISNTAIGDFVVVRIPLASGTSYRNFVAEVISK